MHEQHQVPSGWLQRGVDEAIGDTVRGDLLLVVKHGLYTQIREYRIWMYLAGYCKEFYQLPLGDFELNHVM